MYYYGQHVNDRIMKNYVEFICSQISLNGGAEVNKSDGFPMKGAYVPVKLEIIEKTLRTAIINVTSLGHSKKFTFFLSRQKSPARILSELQDKINETVTEIVLENNLDRDKIFYEHHPLRNLKLPKK